MRLIAHRGFAAVAPENTVSAISAAAERADAVEFDVRRCGSGELVVVHDETLERVTGVDGTVAETPLEDLRTLSVLESGEPIPSLEEVLEVLPADVEVNLEMKDRAIAEDVLAAIARLENRVVLTSFLDDELRAVRELDRDQPTGLLASRRLETPVTTAAELDCEVLGANYWRSLFTPIVGRAKRVDLEVHAWTVERPSVATLLGLRGVDCVSADRPISV